MAVWQTIYNMKELGTSINRFWPALCTEFTRDCNQIYIADYIDGEVEDTACGWARIYESGIYRLRESRPNVRGQDPALGALTVGVELWREVDDRSEWCYARESLIYIGFSPDQDDTWKKTEKLDQHGKFRGALEIGHVLSFEENQPLWVYYVDKGAREEEENEWRERSWFFVLPLFSIRSPADIRTEIVTPIQRLFDGGGPAEVFHGTNAIPTIPHISPHFKLQITANTSR